MADQKDVYKLGLPEFFVVGAPKCGTTALCSYLKAHPSIKFPKIKEPAYFCDDYSVSLVGGWDDYCRLFLESQQSPVSELVVGEGTTLYLNSSTAVSRILSYKPDAKFVVMIRNPVEMIQAWHGQLLYQGFENIADFELAWSAEGMRRLGHLVPRGCPDNSLLYYSSWGALGKQLSRLMSLVEPHQVKLILFDDFKKEPASVYRSVLEFLGVENDGREDFGVVNERKQTRFKALSYLTSFSSSMVSSVTLPLFGKRGLGIGRHIHRINSYKGKPPELDGEFVSKLNSFYRDDVEELSTLFGRDLSFWLK